VINTNLHHISHRFQKLLQTIGQICALERGTVCISSVLGEPLNSGPQNLASRDENSALPCGGKCVSISWTV